MRLKPSSSCEHATAGSAHQGRLCTPPRGDLRLAVLADRRARAQGWAETRHVKTVERLNREAAEAQREWDRLHRWFRIRADVTWSDSKARAKKAYLADRPLPLRIGRTPLPRYPVPLRDRQGKLFVFQRIRYYSAKTTKQGRGAEAARYQMDGAHILPDGAHCVASNMGADYDEIVAAFDQAELVNRTAPGCSKTLFSGFMQSCADLTPEEQFAMAKAYAENAFGSQNLPYLVVLHPPSEEGDQRNWHVHILYSLRPMVRTGEGEWQVGRYLRTDLDSPKQFRRLRMLWAEELNVACERAGLPQRYTHLSYAASGCDFIPQRHLGPGLAAKARRGEHVAVNLANQRIVVRNAAKLALRKGRDDLAVMISRVRRMAESAWETLLPEGVVRTASTGSPGLSRLKGVGIPQAHVAKAMSAVANDTPERPFNHHALTDPSAELPPFLKAAAKVEPRFSAFGKDAPPPPRRLAETRDALVGKPFLAPTGAPPRNLSPDQRPARLGLGPRDAVGPLPPIRPGAALFAPAMNARPHPFTIRANMTLPPAPSENPTVKPVATPLFAATSSPPPTLKAMPLPSSDLQRSMPDTERAPPVLLGSAPIPSGDHLGLLRNQLSAASPPPLLPVIVEKPPRLTLAGTKLPPSRPLDGKATDRLAPQTNAAIVKPPHAQPSSGSAPEQALRGNGRASPAINDADVGEGKSSPRNVGRTDIVRDPHATPANPSTMPLEDARASRRPALQPTDVHSSEALARALDYAHRPAVRTDLMIVGPTGNVTPDPRVWRKHGLNADAVSHPDVQRVLLPIAEEQRIYFEHLQTLLITHVDATARRAGDEAIIQSLPETEREKAAAWTASSQWRNMLVSLRIAHESQERAKKRQKDKLRREQGLFRNQDVDR